MRFLQFCLFFGLNLCQGIKFSLDSISDMPLLLKEGKQQLEVITANSRAPQYGSCWANAVSDLKVGCRYLTEEIQSDLALKLTDCFLQMSGQGAVSCLATRRDCLKQLSDREFNAYTQFYTHTQSICYFLQSKLWHEESEKTIDRLSSTSYKVSMQLEDAERGQEALLKQQLKSLNIQENMAHNMEISKDRINTMMEEIRLTALEQQIALGALFNQLSTLQSWAVGELSWLNSVIFYSSAAILSCLFTSMSRTQRARLPLLLIFTLNYGLEQYCCYILNEESESVVETSANLRSWVWFFRKAAIVICFVVWLRIAFSYCDYNAENYKILVQMRQQHLELREILKRLSGRDVIDSGKDNGSLKPMNIQSNQIEDWVETKLEVLQNAFLREKGNSVTPDITLVRESEKSPSRSTRTSSVQIPDSLTPGSEVGQERKIREGSRYSLRPRVSLRQTPNV